jgi:hypothetical protein
MSYSGWLIKPADQMRILGMYPPRYSIVRAHHVTRMLGKDLMLPDPASIQVVGIACDGRGIEALLVRVNGLIRCPDGRFFHITLSHEEHRAPKESNDVLALQSNWSRVRERYTFEGLPFVA